MYIAIKITNNILHTIYLNTIKALNNYEFTK
jgi:hypothetical protein